MYLVYHVIVLIPDEYNEHNPSDQSLLATGPHYRDDLNP